jgi:hypothetical protein
MNNEVGNSVDSPIATIMSSPPLGRLQPPEDSLMKRALIALFVCALYPASRAVAADPPPDCSAQQTAADDAAKAAKVKADLTACKEMKGKEKTDCEKPLKDKAKEDTKAAKEKSAEAKKALACCKNPKKKGCS